MLLINASLNRFGYSLCCLIIVAYFVMPFVLLMLCVAYFILLCCVVASGVCLCSPICVAHVLLILSVIDLWCLCI